MDKMWESCDPPDLSVQLFRGPIVFKWEGATHVHCGLKNLGNSCYLNATVQALFHIAPFIHLINFLSSTHRKGGSCNNKDCVVCAFRATLLLMSKSSVVCGTAVADLIQVIDRKLSLQRQEDAAEFLLSVLNTIANQEIKRCPDTSKLSYCAQQTTGIHKLFGFWGKATVTCLKCKSDFHDYSSHLNVLISTSGRSVQNGVDTLSKHEYVEEFTCSVCKNTSGEKLKCRRSWQFFTYPQVLIVVVDRFGEFAADEKDGAPLVMNRKLKVATETYSFKSSIIHKGVSKHNGHFICSALCPTGRCVEFDDHEVLVGSIYLQKLSCLTGVFVMFYQLDPKIPTCDKRSRPMTPTKYSPMSKKWKSPLEKPLDRGQMDHLSPKKLGHKKKLLFGKSVLKCNASHVANLAQPLEPDDAVTLPPVANSRLFRTDKVSKQPQQATEAAKSQSCAVMQRGNLSGLSTQPVVTCDVNNNFWKEHNYALLSSKAVEPSLELERTEKIEQTVPSVTILRSRRTVPRDTDSQSSHEYVIRNDNNIKVNEIERKVQNNDKGDILPLPRSTQQSRIPLLTILRSKRTVPKDTDSQSSHEYVIRKDNNIKLNEIERKEKNDYKADTILQRSTQQPTVPSVTILRSKRTKPRETDSQSSHEYNIIKDNTVSNALIDDIFAEEISQNVRHENSPTGKNNNQVPHYNEADIDLFEEDVPGATLPLPNMESNTVKALKRWLVCHGQNPNGIKNVLIKRINECTKGGKPPPIKKDIDKGQWYQRKVDKLRMSYILQSSQVSFPDAGFETFPSKEIPNDFNFGSVFHYLIESRATLQCDESSYEDSEDEEVTDVYINDPFDNHKCKQFMRSKVLRRGLQYVKSGWITGLQDCDSDRYYYVKAHVRASMDAHAYWVYITISKITGGVCQATCGYPCPATANGRCSHVSASLLQILAHVHLNGYQSITCTSRPSEWNRGKLQRKPSEIAERQYDSFKIDVKRRSHFDPRPAAAKDGPSAKAINDFLAAISYKKKPCYWQIHMPIIYEDFQFSDDDFASLDISRFLFYEALEDIYSECRPHQDYKGPMEVPGTQGQSSSSKWRTLRSLHCTASCAVKICHFSTTTPATLKRFLRQHLWGLEQFNSRSCRYGKKNEDTARQAYTQIRKKDDPTVQVHTTGLHLHTEYLGLACSLDGQVLSDRSQPRNLEIKCPFTLKTNDPNDFETVLDNKQLNRFCLTRNASGQLEVKRYHDYYYQMQMQMGMTDIKECDLFIWSANGSILLTVPFDKWFWEKIKNALISFHWDYLVPEYFAMRTPRNLPPITIP